MTTGIDNDKLFDIVNKIISVARQNGTSDINVLRQVEERIMGPYVHNTPPIIRIGTDTINQERTNVTVKGSEGDGTYRVPIPVRFDLIPAIFLRALAEIFEEGAQKYGPSAYRNKPIKFSNLVNHLENHLNLYKMGDRSEKHLAKVAWAVAAMIVLEVEQPTMNDLDAYGGKYE